MELGRMVLTEKTIVKDGKIIEHKRSTKIKKKTRAFNIQPVSLTISSDFLIEKKRFQDVIVREQKLKETLKSDPVPVKCEKLILS